MARELYITSRRKDEAADKPTWIGLAGKESDGLYDVILAGRKRRQNKLQQKIIFSKVPATALFVVWAWGSERWSRCVDINRH